MPTDFENEPEFSDAVSTRRSVRGFTLVETLAVLAIVVLLILLLLPLHRGGAYHAARRAQCINNLKLIALALHNYEQEHKALPPAYTMDSQGNPLHSWRTLILPYLEQGPLYQSIDLAKPWNDPANAKALKTSLGVYRCPESAGPENTTTYLATTAPNGCLIPGQPRNLAEITDGTTLTLMVIEAGEEHAVPWMAPVDADESLVMSLGSAAKLPHTGGVNASFVDGHVTFLKASTPAELLRALMTIAGGEEVLKDW
ncbi:MAG: DUF1559 domain-containing protein [Paludisphaera borealis]|uniref:DUF1559 domain-containing protein n=1 Tax=Paludisphaera borealis TaxID=1387353 RepID=UPI00284B08D1|nr:DUF1559 domain-containing protein [Paludisphaera borealis]MDR3618582.1 DUF1559 domain-containing protein [Paludisphaera borealis]